MYIVSQIIRLTLSSHTWYTPLVEVNQAIVRLVRLDKLLHDLQFKPTLMANVDPFGYIFL